MRKLKITDKQRMDFLERQKWTRWCGYDLRAGNFDQSTVWPVFEGRSFRENIDMAIQTSALLHHKYGPYTGQKR